MMRWRGEDEGGLGGWEGWKVGRRRRTTSYELGLGPKDWRGKGVSDGSNEGVGIIEWIWLSCWELERWCAEGLIAKGRGGLRQYPPV